MEDIFSQIYTVNHTIAESTAILANIRAWEHKTAADYRELANEEKRLAKAVAKKLILLNKLEEAIQPERQKTLDHATVA